MEQDTVVDMLAWLVRIVDCKQQKPLVANLRIEHELFMDTIK